MRGSPFRRTAGSLLFSQIDDPGRDLMLVENFH